MYSWCGRLYLGWNMLPKDPGVSGVEDDELEDNWLTRLHLSRNKVCGGMCDSNEQVIQATSAYHTSLYLGYAANA